METARTLLVKINFDLHSKTIQRNHVWGSCAYTIDSKSLGANYSRCVFVHASRKENRLAHLLDSEGICRGETTYMVEGVPSFATAELEKGRW
ncbi:hypothetical protein CXB51_005225 [Gossypium anomalum]|uniref:RNase H type-1 domain-containing protein n=1 Tax=Gossypium anomalum TaxID=47600 RepID=A0A8J6D8A0_9ROSI|nr:hypothetical protein CXB51_005225 [Gossypium anomalum]